MPLEIIIQIFVLLVAGLSAGFLAGLFGVGGGIVIVPALYVLFTWMGLSANGAISLAVGTSLVTLLPTALASFRAHYRLGNVDFSVLTIIAPAVFFGALLACSAVIEQRGRLLMFVFSVLLIFVGTLTFYRTARKKNTRLGNSYSTSSNVLNEALTKGKKAIAAVAGVVIGGASVLAGVGGGALGVPVLLGVGLSAHRAVGTASCFGLLVALPAITALFIFSYSPEGAPWGTWKQIYLPGFLVLSGCTAMFAPVGAKLGKRLSERRLKLLFSGLLLLVGGRLLYSAYAFGV